MPTAMPTCSCSTVFVSVFASSSAYSRITRRRSPTIRARAVAAQARLGLGARRHLGAGRDGPRNGAGHHVHELPHAGRLGVHEALRALADVAVDAGDLPRARRLPGGELRLHRRVAHLAAERRRFHPVQAAVAGQQDDDDVGGGERGEEQRPAADVGAPEVEDGPVGAGLRVAPQLPSLQPHAERDEQQPDARTTAGMRDEDDQARVRVGGTSPTSSAIASAMNATADTVAISAPTIVSGMPEQRAASSRTSPT